MARNMSDHLSALQGILFNQHVFATGEQNTFESLIENWLKLEINQVFHEGVEHTRCLCY
jgi:hypothetical protein